MNIFKALNIEENEVKIVLLLLGQSIFIGFFFSAFDISASSLFLEYYESTMLPKAFLISGITGMILTFLYSKLQERISFGMLAIINLFIISVITTFIRIGFDLFDIELFVFISLVFMGPLNILAIVGFGGMVGRLFTLRQGKRLFGVIDSGYILGIIIGSYIVPLILQFNFQNKNLLFLSAGSIIIALLIQIVVSARYKSELSTQENQSTEKVSLKILYKNNYLKVMALFVILSMVSAFFINYSFLSVSKMQYPDSTNLASFLGFFNGTMMIFIIILKTFVYSKLVKTYGLQVALMLSPILLGIFTIAASIIGTFSGYTAQAANFGFFFLIIALSRLFSKSMKDSMEMPSFKLLYQSLDSKIRYDVQAKIDGTVNEFSAVFAGLLLVILTSFGFIKLIHFSVILLLGLGIWVYYAYKLYQEYRLSLSENLKKTVKRQEILDESNISDKLINEIESQKDESRALKLLNLFNDVKPIDFQQYILDLLDDSNHPYHAAAFRICIKKPLLIDDKLIKQLEKDADTKELKGADQFIHKAKNLIKEINTKELIETINSKNAEDRIAAALNIQYHQKTSHLSFLKKLLRDYDEDVKKQAIIASAYIYDDDIISILIDYLSVDELFPYAINALEIIGKDVLTPLYQSFYKSEINEITLLRITKIIGKIESEESTNILVNLIDNQNIDIKQNSLYYLSVKQYQTEEKKKQSIYQEIKDLSGIISWNIAAKTSIQERRLGEDLLDAINEELHANFDLMFHFLSIIYNPQSVEQVRDNLETGTAESIGYSLELLDIFIDEEIKNVIFPILEDTSDNEKVNILANYYPIRKYNEKELINRLLSRDLNYINIWTKACALNNIIPENYSEVPEEVLAHIFNPDPMLQELAAIKSNQISADKYQSCSSRLNENNKANLDLIIEEYDKGRYTTYYQRVSFLKKLNLFNEISGKQIYKMAWYITLLDQDSIDENVLSAYPLLAALSGDISVHHNNENILNVNEGSFIFSKEKRFTSEKLDIHMSGNTKLLAFRDNALRNIVADNHMFSNNIINYHALT